MRKSLVSVLAASATLIAGAVVMAKAGLAADYPAKGSTITFVVPFSPGGNSDTTTRILGFGLEKLWPGVSVVVLNKPGAGTQKGMNEVLKAKPDGYTLAHISSGSFFSSYLRPDRKAAYSRASFAPVANHQIGKQAVLVLSESSYKDLKSFVAAAEASPNKVTVGASSVLGTAHRGALGLQKGTGAQFAIVTFGSGSKQRTALLGGHVDSIVTGIDIVMPHLRSGKLRALALVSSERSRYLPNVPTALELGYDSQTNPMQGTAAPAGTPQAVVDTLSKAIGDVLKMPEVIQRFEAAGSEVHYLPAAEYARVLESEERRMKVILADAAKHLPK